MAELAFKVKAEYDEVVSMREELARLRGEMLKVDATTESGQRLMADLEKQYASVSRELGSLVESAARAAVEMKDGMLGADDATIGLMNTIKTGESAINDVFSSLSEQIKGVTTATEDAQAIIGSLIDDMSDKLISLNREKNLAEAGGNNELVDSINAQIDALEAQIDGLKEYRDMVSASSDETNNQIEAIRDAIDAYEDLADQQGNVVDITEESANTMKEELETALQRVLDKMAAFQDSSSEMAGVLDEIKQAAARYHGTSVEVSTVTEVLTKRQGGLSKSTIELAKNLARLVLPANAAKVAISLLTGGLGAAAIAGATILVKKLIDRYKEQKKAAEEVAESQRKMAEEISQSAAKPIAAFDELRRKWVSLSSEMDKKEFLKENKEELQKLGIAIDGVDQAEALFIEHTQDYWNAQITRAKADLYRSKVQGAIEKQIELEDTIEQNREGKRKKQIKLKNGRFTDLSGQEHFANDELGKLLFPNRKSTDTSEFEWVNEEAYNATMQLYELTKNGGELDQLKEKFDDATKASDAANKSLEEGTQIDVNYQAQANKLKSEWEAAKKTYEDVKKDSTSTKKQVDDAKEKLNDAADAYKKWTGESPEQKKTGGLGGSSKKGIDNEAKEREKVYEQYEKQISAMIRSMEDDIAREQLSAIDDNSVAMTKRFDLEKKALVEKAEEIGRAMSELFSGNVDLLNRKTIDAAKLAEKGWEDAGEGIATVFSSQYGITDSKGKEHEILVTPILPDGSVLSERELEDYIQNVLSGANNILEADEKGLVIAIDVDEESGEKLHEMQELYYQLKALIEDYDLAKRENEQKRQEEAEKASMNEFLQQYGSYEEKKLAITEAYEDKITKAKTDGERLIFNRQKEEALRSLEQTYDKRYALIFANANSLSTNLLQEAIEATQQAIGEAKDSGDIQALTNLYARLREQMTVQGERNRGWGFWGISEGLALRTSANEKRALAEELEKKLAVEEAGLSIMDALGLNQEEIEPVRKEVEQLRVEIDNLKDDATMEDERALDSIINGIEDAATAFSTLGGIMASFRNGKGKTLDTIAEIGDGLQGLASHADDLKKAFSGGMTNGEAWSTIISGTIELVSMIGKAIQRNTKAQEEWNRTLAESEHQLKMLELDKMDYEASNIFGVEDPFKRATMGAEQYRKAMEGVTELTDKLAAGKVQTGTKNAVDWGNVGKGVGVGAAIGAAAGTILGPIGSLAGAAIGTAIGAIGGAIAGFASTKVVPVFESLSEHYGELFDPDTYELNPQILADYDKLDEDTKQIVSNWEEIRKKAEDARKELKDNLADFAGDMGRRLEDMLVNAWKNHRLYSAVDDYKKYVGQQIASILEQQAFSAVFDNLFNNLGKRMEDSFLGPNADNSIIDDMDDFNKSFPQYLEAYQMLMDQLNGELEQMGYEGFRDRQENANASTQSYQQISETTGSAIQGGVTALRISSEVRNQHLSIITENMSEMLRQQMLATTLAEDIRGIQVDAYMALVAIRDNTAGNLRSVQNIEGLVTQIEKKTREM